MVPRAARVARAARPARTARARRAAAQRRLRLNQSQANLEAMDATLRQVLQTACRRLGAEYCQNIVRRYSYLPLEPAKRYRILKTGIRTVSDFIVQGLVEQDQDDAAAKSVNSMIHAELHVD